MSSQLEMLAFYNLAEIRAIANAEYPESYEKIPNVSTLSFQKKVEEGWPIKPSDILESHWPSLIVDQLLRSENATTQIGTQNGVPLSMHPSTELRLFESSL